MKSLAALLLLSGLTLTARAQSIDGCPVFPPSDPWNQDISSLPVHPQSDLYIAKINQSRTKLHPDFGSDPTYGIPYVVVDNSTPFVPIIYTDYGDESDPGPMPIPLDAPVEGGASSTGDRHVLAVDKSNCTLYELYNAHPNASGWNASSGAIFDLTKTKYRPDGWTSADAAGLPIFPGLARLDECRAGEIRHALRFTVPTTQKGWITPARHMAGLGDTTYPPMGLRLRLKADYDISKDTGCAKVILTALKKYGMILADNGSAWFISGESNTNWPDDDLNQLKNVPGSAFEAVYTGPTKHTPESAVADEPTPITWSGLSVTPYLEWDRLRLEVHGASQHGIVRLYDMAGRMVREQSFMSESSIATQFDLSIAGVPSGLYLISVVSGVNRSDCSLAISPH